MKDEIEKRRGTHTSRRHEALYFTKKEELKGGTREEGNPRREKSVSRI